MNIYGIVFMTVEGILCFDVLLFLAQRYPKKSPLLDEEISQASVPGEYQADEQAGVTRLRWRVSV